MTGQDQELISRQIAEEFQRTKPNQIFILREFKCLSTENKSSSTFSDFYSAKIGTRFIRRICVKTKDNSNEKWPRYF